MKEVAFDLNLRDEQRCGQMKTRSQAGQRRVVCAEGTAAAGSHLSDIRDPEHQVRNVKMGKAKLAEARVASEYQVEGGLDFERPRVKSWECQANACGFEGSVSGE